MSPVEHFQVFESILYGLTLANLLYGLGRMLKERHSIKAYWAYNLMFVAFFLLVIRQYYTGFGASTFNLVDSPASFAIFVVLNPSLYVLFSHFLIPKDYENLDLRVYALEQKSMIYILLILALVTQILENVFGGYAAGHFSTWDEFLIYASSIFFILFILILVFFLVGAIYGYFSKGTRFTEIYIVAYFVFVVLIMFVQ